MEKRWAESAGTFDIASEILKPSKSHTREPRLSKMHLVTKIKRLKLVKHQDRSIHITYNHWRQMAAVLLERLFQAGFLSSLCTAVTSVELQQHHLHWDAPLMLRETLSTIWLIQMSTKWHTNCKVGEKIQEKDLFTCGVYKKVHIVSVC